MCEHCSSRLNIVPWVTNIYSRKEEHAINRILRLNIAQANVQRNHPIIRDHFFCFNGGEPGEVIGMVTIFRVYCLEIQNKYQSLLEQPLQTAYSRPRDSKNKNSHYMSFHKTLML